MLPMLVQKSERQNEALKLSVLLQYKQHGKKIAYLLSNIPLK